MKLGYLSKVGNCEARRMFNSVFLVQASQNGSQHSVSGTVLCLGKNLISNSFISILVSHEAIPRRCEKESSSSSRRIRRREKLFLEINGTPLYMHGTSFLLIPTHPTQAMTAVKWIHHFLCVCCCLLNYAYLVLSSDYF